MCLRFLSYTVYSLLRLFRLFLAFSLSFFFSLLKWGKMMVPLVQRKHRWVKKGADHGWVKTIFVNIRAPGSFLREVTRRILEAEIMFHHIKCHKNTLIWYPLQTVGLLVLTYRPSNFRLGKFALRIKSANPQCSFSFLFDQAANRKIFLSSIGSDSRNYIFFCDIGGPLRIWTSDFIEAYLSATRLFCIAEMPI